MDMNPQRVRTATFNTVKKGLDPTEVHTFLSAVADELERAQNQSTAMEARARAAVARLQELSDEAATQSATAESAAPPADAQTPAPPDRVDASVDQTETISRTLLLAQRTADTTVAEAKAEAEKLRADADAEVTSTLSSTREMAATLLEEARVEARRVGADERSAAEAEFNALRARRDFLESDVDHLEQFLVEQRSRLRDAANEIIELTERVPSGLGETRRPLLSASDDDTVSRAGGVSPDDDITLRVDDDDTAAMPRPTPESDDDVDELWLPDDDADDVMPVIDTSEPGSASSIDAEPRFALGDDS
jgi:DivIVA domain-containing protein